MTKTIIHIGYPKSGSTFLQKYFLEHPDIHYDSSIFNEYKKSGEINRELLSVDLEKSFTVFSEEQISVWGGREKIDGQQFFDFGIKDHQKKVASDLFDLFPQAKVLIVVRGYDSLLQSLYSQYVSVGGILKWDDFLKSIQLTFPQFYDYNYLISIYYELFGRENTLVLPFEMLKNSHTEFLCQLESFFGIRRYDFSGDELNKSIQDFQIDKFLRLSSIVSKFLKILPAKYNRKVYSAYGDFLYKKKEQSLRKFVDAKKSYFEISDFLLPLEDATEILKEIDLVKPYLKHYILK